MINWKKICNKIEYYESSLGEDFGYAESNPMETIEVASHNGDLYDLDNMVAIKDIINIPITYELYNHIGAHYDGSLLELEKEDLPQLEWLIEDYVVNGKLKDNIWEGYDYKKYQDESGFCGWHKRVMDGIKERTKRVVQFQFDVLMNDEDYERVKKAIDNISEIGVEVLGMCSEASWTPKEYGLSEEE